MDDYDRFTILVTDALSNVSQSYYTTVYKNIESFKAAFGGRQGVLNNDTFERYGERVFCYEFYHQFRILLENERTTKPEFLSGASLQGEVDKMQLIELAEHLGLEPLSGRFVPDFLMHSAGDSSNHAFVIEVKCIEDLSSRAFMTDLQKINQFIVRYRYKRGLFISVNSQPETIINLIESNQEELNRLLGRSRIAIICKPNQDSEHQIHQL